MRALRGRARAILFLGALFATLVVGGWYKLRSAGSGGREIWKYSWATAIPEQSVPEGLEGLSAAECGQCHEAIYEEWRRSAHANAWVDPQYQFEWAKDRNLWLCLNCHIPLTNQQASLVRGFRNGDIYEPIVERNPSHDPTLMEEGITCAVCHVRDGAVLGVFGDTGAPHEVRVSPELTSHETCLLCHNAIGQITGTLVCNFDTGDDWAGTGLSETEKDCLHCHMPRTSRPLVDGEADRAGRHHTWFGAGIPKDLSDSSAVLPQGLLAIEIVPDPAGYVAGKTGRISIEVANREAGHSVPTGDVERFVLLTMRLREAGIGRILWEREERIGEVWEWYPAANKVSDNSLSFGEERTYHYEFVVPPDADGLEFQVNVENHRMTIENARAMDLPGKYPLHKRVQSVSASLDLRSGL